MSEETPTIENREPARPTDRKRTAILIGIVLLLATFAWLFASKMIAVRDAERAGARNAAAAMAAATAPLLDLRNKNLLGDRDALQRVVDGIVANKGFTFAAILNTDGSVLAASDRNTGSGSEYPDFKGGEASDTMRGGKYEVIAPVKQGAVVYGAVVLRLP